MKKIMYILPMMVLMVTSFVVATSFNNVVNTIDLVTKDPSTWNIIEDGNCGGFDYTGDSQVNFRDFSEVVRNKIDVNIDGTYNNDDRQLIKDNYQDCRVGKGVVSFSAITNNGKIVQERVNADVWSLTPKTEYQLIYYGDETNNDVWSYATCIGNARKTSTNGFINNLGGVFEHSQMIDDGINQKFWVVLADDVDCDAGMMISWNPSEYLFENNVI